MLVPTSVRVVSAALTDGRTFGGAGLIAPGEEFTVGGVRFLLVRADVDGISAVSGGWGFSVRLTPVEAGTLVDVLGGSRAWADAVTRSIAGRSWALREASVVVGAAIIRDGAVLAQQRAYPAEVAGKWELPGGRVEAGESDVDAVRRECLEELGIYVVPGEVIGPDVAVRDDLLLRIHAARLEPADQVPHPHDHAALTWLDAAALDSVDWLPADRVLLPALREALRGSAGQP